MLPENFVICYKDFSNAVHIKLSVMDSDHQYALDILIIIASKDELLTWLSDVR